MPWCCMSILIYHTHTRKQTSHRCIACLSVFKAVHLQYLQPPLWHIAKIILHDGIYSEDMQCIQRPGNNNNYERLHSFGHKSITQLAYMKLSKRHKCETLLTPEHSLKITAKPCNTLHPQDVQRPMTVLQPMGTKAPWPKICIYYSLLPPSINEITSISLTKLV